MICGRQGLLRESEPDVFAEIGSDDMLANPSVETTMVGFGRLHLTGKPGR